LTRANNLLCSSTEPTKFVTLFLGTLDTKSNEICFSNAGHDPPLHFSDNKIDRLSTGGILLGTFPDSLYEQQKIIMKPGDLLILISDGITEAMNKENQEFSEEKLIDVIEKNINGEPEILIDKIVATVKDHAGTTPQSDDMTLMIIKRAVE
ncbi:MAG: serine/threonine-protein phosphatase, partial [Ignavibacteria bacterium]|nr:serine/threonine-protein phosphatase [Ignavibacteria bacterium]